MCWKQADPTGARGLGYTAQPTMGQGFLIKINATVGEPRYRPISSPESNSATAFPGIFTVAVSENVRETAAARRGAAAGVSLLRRLVWRRGPGDPADGPTEL